MYLSRRVLAEYGGTEEIIIRGDVFQLLGKGTYAFEFARCRRELVFFSRHRFSHLDDPLFLKIQNEAEDLSVSAVWFCLSVLCKTNTRQHENQYQFRFHEFS